MTYVAAVDRYEKMPYRRCGRSGIDLPEVSLGQWQNFGAAGRLGRALPRWKGSQLGRLAVADSYS
jgi:L-glyceraldehyde 3-phosphate reductase